MQITEVSVVGVRCAVIALGHRRSPLRFVLVPTIHIGHPDFYRRVTERIATCDLVLAEQYDGPSTTGLAAVLASRLTGQRLGARLVHQDIDYRALGVPTEFPDGFEESRRYDRVPWYGWFEVAALAAWQAAVMALGGREWLMRQNFEVSDDSDVRLRSAVLTRWLLHERDELLVEAVERVHAARAGEPIEVAVVFGAAHMPAVVRALTGPLGYRPQRGAEWLHAIHF